MTLGAHQTGNTAPPSLAVLVNGRERAVGTSPSRLVFRPGPNTTNIGCYSEGRIVRARIVPVETVSVQTVS